MVADTVADQAADHAADHAAPFTAQDYAARMRRAAFEAARAGLAGLLVTPGPDLVWLTG
jgi:hypothetical protein